MRKSPAALLSGFTMVEMMVSVAVFSVVIAMAFSTLMAASEARKAASAKFDIYRNAQATLAFIAQELRSAKLYEQDLRFLQAASPNQPPPDLNLPNNGRGRLIINNWPPLDKNPNTASSLIPYRGNGIDDDGDRRIDEEAFDGMDNDGDGEQGGPVHPLLGYAMADGIDNDKDGEIDEGIDEDIFYPLDMLNFVSFRDGREIEVGYAIDPVSMRDLWRRTAFFSATGLQPPRLDGIYPVSVDYAMGNNTAAPLAYPGQQRPLMPWFDTTGGMADQGEKSRTSGAVSSNSQGRDSNESLGISQFYDVMALNILGFDCRAYYYDYLLGEENSNLQDTLVSGLGAQIFNPYAFKAFSWDSSFENSPLNPYPFNSEINIFPNEPNDLAVIPGTHLANALKDQPGKNRAAERIASAVDRTDGLPRMLEITLFVQDQQRVREEPVRVSMRVTLPFGKGEEPYGQ